MDISLNKLRKMGKDREAWCAAVTGLQSVGQDLTTEQQHWEEEAILSSYRKLLMFLGMI